MVWAHFCFFLPHSLGYSNYYFQFTVHEAWGEIPSQIDLESLDSLLHTESRLSLALHGEKRRKKPPNLWLTANWVKKARDEINIPYAPLDVRTSVWSIRLQGRSEAELLQRQFSRQVRSWLVWQQKVCRLFEEVGVTVLLRSLGVK